VNDVSAIAARDFEEQKPKILGRMVARGLFKEISATKAEALGPRQRLRSELTVSTAFVTGKGQGNVARFKTATSQVDYQAPTVRPNR
jgi:hypothetical protein